MWEGSVMGERCKGAVCRGLQHAAKQAHSSPTVPELILLCLVPLARFNYSPSILRGSHFENPVMSGRQQRTVG